MINIRTELIINLTKIHYVGSLFRLVDQSIVHRSNKCWTLNHILKLWTIMILIFYIFLLKIFFSFFSFPLFHFFSFLRSISPPSSLLFFLFFFPTSSDFLSLFLFLPLFPLISSIIAKESHDNWAFLMREDCKDFFLKLWCWHYSNIPYYDSIWFRNWGYYFLLCILKNQIIPQLTGSVPMVIKEPVRLASPAFFFLTHPSF